MPTARESHVDATDLATEARKAEALLETGALQRAIFNSANFSSIATDAKGVIQIFNVGAERMLGYTAADVVNTITPADISDPQEVIARATALSLELGTPIAPGFEALVFKASRGIEDIYELTYIRKDGSRFPAVVSITALRDVQDAIIGYLLIGTDNTARKQAEEALLQAGALQRAIFNSANFSSIATDAKGVIQIFNVGAERMLGYTAADVVNTITPADISDPQEVIARATALSLELGTPIAPGFEALVFKASRGIEDIYELTYIRKDGSRFPAVVSITALRDVQDAIIGYLLIGTDNTARKQAEEALLQAGALQRAIFNSANFSSIATDANGVIQIFNVGAERMLGYTAADVVNTITPADISDPQEVIARATALSLELGTPIAPGFEALVFKASRGIEDIYELTYIRKDGSRFPAVVSITALRDVQDAIIGYLLIGTDNTARKQAEEALLQAGALQRAIFNSANFSSIATDAKGVIQIFNVGAERMLGYTAADVVNTITPADISDPQEVIARATALSLELGTPIAPGFEALVFKASRGIEDIYELTYFRKDGSRFPAVVSITALRDAQDAIIGYLLIGTDNTARKQAEEALLQAGALQRAIFNSANFSSIATDAKGVIQIFNVGAERMLGYTAAEVVNTIPANDLHDRREVNARAAALSVEFGIPIAPGFEALVFKAARGIEDIYELTAICKDGSRLPAVVSVTALRDAQGAIIGYLIIGTDNTARQEIKEERKKLDQRLQEVEVARKRAEDLEHQVAERQEAEAAVRVERDRAQQFLDTADVTLLALNVQGRITLINRSGCDLLGWTERELLGRNFVDTCVPARMRDETRAGFADVLAGPDSSIVNGSIVTKSGEERMVEWRNTLLRNHDGEVVSALSCGTDLTIRHRLDEERVRTADLERQGIEARQANRLKSEFLANMSHELRTPLNAIIGFTALMKKGGVGPVSEMQQTYLGDVLTSSRHLLQLINDVLDLAKVESGKIDLRPEPIDLAQVVNEVGDVLRGLAAIKRLRIEIQADPEITAAVLDPSRVKQILYNFLSNAIKFTPEGGHVEVLIAPDGPDHFRIDVTDSGAGIAAEDVQRLFVEFQQLDAPGSKKHEGTGLGLVLTKRLVEAHGGRVTARSTVGLGSTFSAILPRRLMVSASGEVRPVIGSPHGDPTLPNGTDPLVEELRRKHVPTPVAEAGTSQRILVVDDNPQNLELARLVLCGQGYRVETAVDAEDALSVLESFAPRLILMDVQLPGMNGLDLTRKLKADPIHGGIVIIAVTAYAMKDDAEKAFAAGCDGYLSKPIDIDALPRIVADHLARTAVSVKGTASPPP